MAVMPNWRRRGIGSRLLKHLLVIAHQQQLPQVFLNAQVSALDFYEKAGFLVEGETFMDAGIQHKRMVLQLEQID
jgi:predicted GNAT family N-acyltransferase